MTTINIRKDKAVFISREGAAKSIIREAKQYGLEASVVATRGRILPQYNRGVLMGYIALCPRPDGSVSAILEN